MATRHDEELKREISSLKRDGFIKIKADISGYDKPDPIGSGGFIPDYQASKPGKIVIGELEEESNVTGHKDQISSFRRSAAQKSHTQFILTTYKRGQPGKQHSN